LGFSFHFPADSNRPIFISGDGLDGELKVGAAEYFGDKIV
jgi:hypothetical protein